MARGPEFENSIISPANDEMLVAFSSNFCLEPNCRHLCCWQNRILVSATVSLAMKEESSHHRC